jgi:hypothetical protein
LRLQISKDLSLPLEAGRWTFADLAIKSAGKTYAAGVLAEEMIKAGIPVVVLDGIGVWWGLRAPAASGGRTTGLPVAIFGGQHKDRAIPTMTVRGRETIDEERLRLMVKAVLDSGISVVLDTSEFGKSTQRRIVATFVNEIYHLSGSGQYGVRHVFIEEADMWVPQRIVGDVALSAGAIDDLVRRGGNFNLGCTLISQRPAVVNKDVLTQINCLIALRILAKIDKLAVKTWVESAAGEDQPKIQKWYESLGKMENGEAWVWHPQTPVIFKHIKFRKKETLHATREFFLERKINQQNVRMMDVGEFLDKYDDIFEPKPKATAAQVPRSAEGIGKQRVPARAPIPEAPIMAQRRVVSQAPKHLSAATPYGELGRGREGSGEMDRRDERREDSARPTRSEGETYAGEEVRSTVPPPEPHEAGSKVGSFSLVVRKLEADSLDAAALYILNQHNGGLVKTGDLMNEAMEYGWTNPKSSWSTVLARLVERGFAVGDGHGSYRKPKKVEVEEVSA